MTLAAARGLQDSLTPDRKRVTGVVVLCETKPLNVARAARRLRCAGLKVLSTVGMEAEPAG